MTEQRPLAAVLGTELELRLFNYRDTTPLRAGQVDDEPYGGGAGMVLRVDVVAAALDAVYGELARAAGDRADAAGAAADPGGRRGARGRAGADAPLLALRGLRRADRHAPLPPTRSRSARTCSPAASCRRWCCSTRSRVGCRARSPRDRASTRASRPSSRAVSSIRTTRGPPSSAAGPCPDVLLSGDHGRVAEWRKEQSRERSAHQLGTS